MSEWRFVNRYTGQSPTARELAACQQHARSILANPYAAPESVEWALMVPGVDDAIDAWFWESNQDRGIRRQRVTR